MSDYKPLGLEQKGDYVISSLFGCHVSSTYQAKSSKKRHDYNTLLEFQASFNGEMGNVFLYAEKEAFFKRDPNQLKSKYHAENETLFKLCFKSKSLKSQRLSSLYPIDELSKQNEKILYQSASIDKDGRFDGKSLKIEDSICIKWRGDFIHEKVLDPYQDTIDLAVQDVRNEIKKLTDQYSREIEDVDLETLYKIQAVKDKLEQNRAMLMNSLLDDPVRLNSRRAKTQFYVYLFISKFSNLPILMEIVPMCPVSEKPNFSDHFSQWSRVKQAYLDEILSNLDLTEDHLKRDIREREKIDVSDKLVSMPIDDQPISISMSDYWGRRSFLKFIARCLLDEKQIYENFSKNLLYIRSFEKGLIRSFLSQKAVNT